MFKVQSCSAPSFISDIFTKRDCLQNSVVSNLRSQTDFYNYHNPKSVHFGSETLRALGPKIWNIILYEIKNSPSLALFKRKIKDWVPKKCPCRLCLKYVEGFGYIAQ